jgi:MYXO-CTERM domain-containing protein
MNTTSHVVYRAEGPMGDEVWAFDLYEQEYTRLSDPNYHWNVRSVDIEGNQVVWSASYSDNGPEYEDWEIYTYHLLEGPTSYEQVTQNSVSDIDPRTNGESAAWLTGVFEDGFLTTDQLITNEGGVHNVIAESNYFREFVYDDVIAWTIHYSEAAGGALRIRDGNDEYQFSEHAGAYYLQVDGKNLAWMESDVPPGDPNGDFEIWAAYYIGRSAVLTGLDLSLMDLSDEPLFGADLRYTDLRSALIEGTDFRGADFTGATNLEYAIGQAIFSHQTILPEYFNAHDAGWSYVTPEPTALLLALFGLALLPRRRRREVFEDFPAD